jgi:3-deoxy-D-manno-octulosonic-acid transferase
VLSGPNQFSSPQVAQALTEAHALIIVHSAAELAEELLRLLRDPTARAKQGAAARAVIDANRGARVRLLELIGQRLAS